MRRASRASTSRSAGVVPLAAGVLSAMTLTGAAVYTVTEARCAPARYVQEDSAIALVGGCLDGAELREKGLGHDHRERGTSGEATVNFRP